MSYIFSGDSSYIDWFLYCKNNFSAMDQFVDEISIEFEGKGLVRWKYYL